MRNKYGSTPLDEIHPRYKAQAELRVQQMQGGSTGDLPKLFQDAVKAGVAERKVTPLTSPKTSRHITNMFEVFFC